MAKPPVPRSEFTYTLEDKKLCITPHSRRAAIELNREQKRVDPEEDPEGFVELVTAMEPVILRGDNWYRIEMETDYPQSLLEAVQKWTRPFAFEPIDVMSCFDPLQRTHILDTMVLHDDGRLVVAGYNSGYDRDEKYAHHSFAQSILAKFGERETIREYIPADDYGDRYKLNPDYARRQGKIFKRLPQYTSDELQRVADLLWEIWLKSDRPSPDQRSLLRAGLLNDRSFPTLRDYTLYYRSEADDASDWDRKGTKFKTVTPEQFRKLGLVTS